jgi:hypothetical protein
MIPAVPGARIEWLHPTTHSPPLRDLDEDHYFGCQRMAMRLELDHEHRNQSLWRPTILKNLETSWLPALQRPKRRTGPL